MSLLKRQLELEQEGVTKGVEDYKAKVAKSPLTDLLPGQVILKEGMTPLTAAIDDFMTPQVGAGRLCASKKFFRMLGIPSDELAYLTLRFCLTEAGEALTLSRASIKLCDTVLDHHEYTKFKKLNPGYLRMLEENQSSNMQHRRTVVMLKKRQWGIGDTVMSDEEKSTVGQKLIELCVKSTGLVRRRSIRQFVKGKPETSYVLVFTESTLLKLAKYHGQCELLSPTNMPMIMKPKAWTSAVSGGYYSDSVTHRNKAVKTRNSKALDSLEQSDMTQVYSALNAIQDVPWTINSRVLAVLDAVWDGGGCLGGLPSPEITPLPTKPWSNDAQFKDMKDNRPDLVKRWKKQALKIYDDRIGEGGQRVNVTSKLALAHKFADEKEIFFPHTLDWRGRVYPLPSWINPQADDLGKGLLQFAEGKALGATGAYWLAVHGANTYGKDKISFDDRVQWVKDNEVAILDSAENPLDGMRFWCATDENGTPFADSYCFLAFCFEWAEYKKNPSFLSHLPIGLDGTCNGLQHFCGMLLDAEGGKFVNLLPSDVPQDIYSKVAKVVSGLVQIDADSSVAQVIEKLPKSRVMKPKEDKNGNLIPVKVRDIKAQAETVIEMAKLWVGKIDRGIAKRPTMTKPYGAKKHGYKFQLMSELKKRGGSYLGVENPFQPAVYLADRMNDGINQVVIAARDAMDFLRDVSKVVAKNEQPITWKTPVGFPAWQEYRESDRYRVRTFWGEVSMRLHIKRELVTFNKNKMSNSISPNFVHSMDASMLMDTVNSCTGLGINNFAMIHDSYGTHACDTEVLAQELRNSFVKMYSVDILAKFLEEVKQQLPEELHSELPELPAKGTLDLAEVKNSRYFFA